MVKCRDCIHFKEVKELIAEGVPYNKQGRMKWLRERIFKKSMICDVTGEKWNIAEADMEHDCGEFRKA